MFCGVYLEALLHLLFVEKHDKVFAKKHDNLTYEDKLSLLGCSDQSIFDSCKHYRKVRREVVHEKAHFDTKYIRKAQTEALLSIELVEKINANLGITRG